MIIAEPLRVRLEKERADANVLNLPNIEILISIWCQYIISRLVAGNLPQLVPELGKCRIGLAGFAHPRVSRFRCCSYSIARD